MQGAAVENIKKQKMKNKTTKQKATSDLDSLFCTNHNKLQIDEGIAKARILDAELDILNCSFNGDRCVKIDTKKLTYITLTLQNLKELKKLIIKSEKYYNN